MRTALHYNSPEVWMHKGQPALRQRCCFFCHVCLFHHSCQIQRAFTDAVIGANLSANVKIRNNYLFANLGSADHVFVPHRLTSKYCEIIQFKAKFLMRSIDTNARFQLST